MQKRGAASGRPFVVALGGAAVRGALDRGAGQEARADELALALVRRLHGERDAESRGLRYGVEAGGAHGRIIGIQAREM
jgi:hypothetical protein